MQSQLSYLMVSAGTCRHKNTCMQRHYQPRPWSYSASVPAQSTPLSASVHETCTVLVATKLGALLSRKTLTEKLFKHLENPLVPTVVPLQHKKWQVMCTNALRYS